MASHDALHPETGSVHPFGEVEPIDGLPLIPQSAADDLPNLNIHLGSSSSGSDDNFGSSTFVLPANLVAPDPLLGALADTPGNQLSEELPPLETAPVVADPYATPESHSFPSDEFRALTGLNLDAPAAESVPAESAPRSTDAESDEIVYVTGPNWPMMLLASYASAVTLALIWFVILPKFRSRGEIEGYTAEVSAVAKGARRSDTSRKVEPAQPIPAERTVRLGERLRVGSLEITPIEVDRQAVRLRRSNFSGKTETRDGGASAMALRIKLQNTSIDTIFKPLDPAFIRDKDDGVPDSYVELPNHERIYLYPLPAESEWSIVNQSFPDLKPGEAKETRIITTADFPTAEAGMTWRLRLRTGIDSTEIIAVSIPPDK